MPEMHHSTFHATDYIVFGITLLLSLLIGVYHAIKLKFKANHKKNENTKETETDDYLMGGRSMPVIPVVLSSAASILSGISILGVPGEIYRRGALMWLYMSFGTVSTFITAYVVLSVIYRLGPVSINEYVDRRFNSKPLRRLSSLLFILNSAFYMGIVIYAPSIALSAVTNLPYEPLIVTTALVCTVYTTIGGLKAVVWTDTFQALFMYGGIITVIVKGTIQVGGLGKVFEIPYTNDRISPIWNVDPNPVQYFSLWIAMVGGFCYGGFGVNQMESQRYCSMATFKQARQVVLLTIPVYLLFMALCSFMGLVALAFFWGCDPLETGEIKSQNQIVILMVMKTMGGLPGMPGLFLACLYSGTLSTVSSCINSMAAVTWEDFLKDRFGHLSDHRQALITKVVSVVYGLVSIALGFLAGLIGSIVGATFNTLGAVSGPISALFLMGILLPKANKNVVFTAVVTGSCICAWLSLGNLLTSPYSEYKLNTNIDYCSFGNTTSIQNSTTTFMTPPVISPTLSNATISVTPYDNRFGNPEVSPLYRISSFLYPAIGLILTLVIGFLLSFWKKNTESWKIDELTIWGIRKERKVHVSKEIQLKMFVINSDHNSDEK